MHPKQSTIQCLPIALLTCLLFGSLLNAHSQLTAFPGAEGCGKYSQGGRGNVSLPTTVYEVTNLNDDAFPGSLRYALIQNVPYRTIVFRVSGTIHLNSKLVIKANTTIAGQTAPGDGICLADYPVVISGDHVIVRYIRIRMGDKNQNGGMVDGSGGDDAFGNLGNKHIIIDHCSVSWSSDEALTFYRGDSLTLQWNIVSEPLNYSYHFEAGGTDFQEHGYGGIWGSRNGSFHHNLIAHCKGRCPRFAGSSTYSPNTAGTENADFRNNVIYNWGSYSTNGGEGGNYNLVNNYYKYGPSTSSGNNAGIPARFMIMNPSQSSSLPFPKLFIEGNYVDGSSTITADNWKGIAMSGGSLADTVLSKVLQPFNLLPVPEQSATEAYNLVLLHSGAVLPNRDTLDQRLVGNVQNRTGKIIDVQGGFPHGTPYPQTVSAWPTLTSGTAPADGDHDGMPDAWETAQGLNPSNASDRNNIAPNGYTWLENYLNSLAYDALELKGSLNNFSQSTGTPSAVQSYTFTGNHLTGDVTITAPAGFQISVDGNSWSSGPLTLVQTNGSVAATTVYVRLNAATPGNYSGSLIHRSYVGATVMLTVNGSTSATTAILQLNNQNAFSLYPNPALSGLQIAHPYLQQDQIFRIYTADGKLAGIFLARKSTNHTTADISHLPSGNYFIESQKGKSKTTLAFKKM